MSDSLIYEVAKELGIEIIKHYVVDYISERARMYGKFKRAYELAQAGHDLQAVNVYKELVTEDPKDFLSWHNMAESLIELNRYSEGENALSHAIAIYPSGYRSWGRLGDIYLHCGNYTRAKLCYDVAVRLAPSTAYYWVGRGATLIHLRRYEEALKCYKRALQIEPYDTTAKEGIKYLREKGIA